MRSIDDLLLINNNNYLKDHKHDIYPKELDLSSDDKNDQQVHYLDLDILIVGSGFSYCIYDKRDNFNFSIVNFSDLNGNIPLVSLTMFLFHNLCVMLVVVCILKILKLDVCR